MDLRGLRAYYIPNGDWQANLRGEAIRVIDVEYGNDNPEVADWWHCRDSVGEPVSLHRMNIELWQKRLV